MLSPQTHVIQMWSLCKLQKPAQQMAENQSCKKPPQEGERTFLGEQLGCLRLSTRRVPKARKFDFSASENFFQSTPRLMRPLWALACSAIYHTVILEDVECPTYMLPLSS